MTFYTYAHYRATDNSLFYRWHFDHCKNREQV